MAASDGVLPVLRLLRVISEECGWTGFRQPAWQRLHSLPGLRSLARSAASSR
ncbi:MAG TPA: hypothetical protein VGI05_09045 [Streptosporangiaceae bacterium]|jgi:hypothetical protein